MKQLFINIVGHNSSGKTTLAKRLEEDLGFSRVSGDDLREFIHDSVAYFSQTDMSYPNDRYNELNQLVIDYRQELSWILLKNGQSVLFDGSGSTKEYRQRYLAKVKENFPGITRVIIWADIAENELVERLTKRGKKWLDQYHDLKKQSFQPPANDEAEIVLRYDQSNYDEIASALKSIN